MTMRRKKRMRETSYGYIIDVYNNFHHNYNVVSTFNLNGHKYCIRRIEDFEWGQPVFPEKDIDDNFTQFYVFNTLEKAEKFVRELKELEGILI